MRLHLDHVIIRAADPAATLAELTARTGAPVLADIEDFGAVQSGIARAGAVDLEVLRIGRDAPAQPVGYGLGFVADVPLDEAVATLRGLGFATSMPIRGVAGAGERRRTWRAVQVHGLLPDPFPAPVTTRRPGGGERAGAAIAGLLARIPAVARAATRDAGGSMVVVTEYDFDADAWRAGVEPGPELTEVHVGTNGAGDAWRRLPLAAGGPLRLAAGTPAGLTRIALAGAEPFSLGEVRVESAS